MKKVLISTIQPVTGGVPMMLNFVLGCLAERECEVTIAYYEPYSVSPNYSVPFFKLPMFKSPSNKTGENFQGKKCVGVGCWFPELEFTNYWATSQWKTLIQEHDVHLCASGSAMAALPYVQTQTEFLAWVATDWLGDRIHRVKEFSWPRRVLDRFFVSPITKRLEKSIIHSGTLIALSDHTEVELNKIASTKVVDHVMPMPIDTELFRPCKENSNTDVFKIGFLGRFDDPRKNIGLLLDSFSELIKDNIPVELTLIGGELSKAHAQRVKELEIDAHLTVVPYVERHLLPGILSSWETFVIPSHQEGLCIAALEAMSCGVPVISTKCGGPEGYINDGENGILIEHTVGELKEAVIRLYSNSHLREAYAAAARSTVVADFSVQSASTQFLNIYDKMCFPVKTQ